MKIYRHPGRGKLAQAAGLQTGSGDERSTSAQSQAARVKVPTTSADNPDVDADSRYTPASAAREVGGPKGPEPTRYGDWERKGRCIDF